MPETPDFQLLPLIQAQLPKVVGFSTQTAGEYDPNDYPASVFIPYPMPEIDLPELVFQFDFESSDDLDKDGLELALTAIPPEQFLPDPEPDWLALLTEFAIAGNTLYSAIQTKCAASGSPLAMDAFQTLKLVILQPDLRSPLLLARAMGAVCEYIALSDDEIKAWNDYMVLKNFPDICQLQPN